jgi:WD40 repeat protein
LASGGTNGEIKVWNLREQACIHSFNPHFGKICSLFFLGGADSACIAVANSGSIFRLWRAEGSLGFASENIDEAAGGGGGSYAPRARFSPSGSFLATSVHSLAENRETLALYDLETMTKTQSVVIPDVSFGAACFALSPDSKQLVLGTQMGGSRLFQSDDFSIQRDLVPRGVSSIFYAAFDPTCRVLAFGSSDGIVELRTL